MFILLTNDDGYFTPGLKALTRAVEKVADIAVIAPESEKSAISHSISLHDPIRIKEIAANRYLVKGTPTDCVYLGINYILNKKPDLVIAGINPGANMGDDITYSGTVCAAMEGCLLGVPSFAISLAKSSKMDFDSTAQFALKVINYILKSGLPKNTFLNINVPAEVDPLETKVVYTSMGRRKYGGEIIRRVDPRGNQYYWIGGDENGYIPIKESDCLMLHNKFVSITPLKIDLTDYKFLEEMDKSFDWKK